ncbi:MAG: hypothetical protein LUD81_09930 [Clostridiales bacterium]|nr:hypothetical protein [Clostridiales bacterium]
MKANKKVIGLVLTSFGLGVVSSVIFPGLGFFYGCFNSFTWYNSVLLLKEIIYERQYHF